MEQCAELKEFVDYDPWVIAHQLLPFIAAVNGIPYLEIFLLMYAWETFETILFNCVGVSEEETMENALISDPFQCLFGVMVACAYLGFQESIIKNDKFKSYCLTVIYILPSIFLSIDNKFAWLYMVFFILIMCGTVYFIGNEKKWFFKSAIYVITFGVLVITLETEFNSFYVGLLTSVFFSSVALLHKYLTENT